MTTNPTTGALGRAILNLESDAGRMRIEASRARSSGELEHGRFFLSRESQARDDARLLSELLESRLAHIADRVPPSDDATCPVCEDVIGRLGGHKDSRLDGETGLAAATMRGHEALLRVCDLLESWKVTLKNRNVITWDAMDAMDAGDTKRLKMAIDHLKAAISPPNVGAIKALQNKWLAVCQVLGIGDIRDVGSLWRTVLLVASREMISARSRE